MSWPVFQKLLLTQRWSAPAVWFPPAGGNLLVSAIKATRLQILCPISVSWLSERIMPPTKIPVPPLQGDWTSFKCQEGLVPKICPGAPTCLCRKLHKPPWPPAPKQSTPTPLLSLSPLLRLQTRRSVLLGIRGKSRMAQSWSLHRPSFSVYPFFQILPPIQAFQDPLRGTARSKPCCLFTFGFHQLPLLLLDLYYSC